jgi:hypothetical protein
MRFSTRLLRKGALIDETRMVLRYWNPQISVRENINAALGGNQIGAKSAGWLKEIIQTLSVRLTEIKGYELAGLQVLASSAVSDEVWRASFHWHCARTDQMYYAFVTEWLFNTYRQGVYRIRTQDLVPLVSDLTTQAKGKGASFSDYGVTRAARDLLLTATDFGLLKGKAVREFVSFHLPEESFLYLLHAMTEAEPNARRMIDSTDWHIYLMEASDVERELMRLHQFRKLHYEVAGSLVQLKLPCGSAAEYAKRLYS